MWTSIIIKTTSTMWALKTDNVFWTVPIIEMTCILIKRFGTDKFCAVNNFSHLCGAKTTIITLKVVQAQVRFWFGMVEKKLWTLHNKINVSGTHSIYIGAVPRIFFNHANWLSIQFLWCRCYCENVRVCLTDCTCIDTIGSKVSAECRAL